MPVHVAEDGTVIERDSVYVLSADSIISIHDRRLSVRKNTKHRERKPIDIFFSALAVDCGELSAGIVLSGGDGDGTLGIKAIKERGGLTLAQAGDGFGPAHPDMPESAIATGFVDLAIPVGEMGAKLAEFGRGASLPDRLTARPQAEAEAALVEIYAILRNQIGHDFSGYKNKTFIRRVQRRMYVTHIESYDGYLECLRREPQEVRALFRDLLINVTNFFRDADAFEALAATVVPKLFEGRGANDTVRVWIPGCSTGEEVFSIAILLREHMETLNAVPRVQIFATDIDERALAVARAARYPAALLDSVTEARRKRFFLADAGSFVVSKDVRDLCIFSPHSVIRDPPFSRIDLVSCRNLLIYFGSEVQGQVIPIFHYALRPGGYLFLGSAENISQFEDLFLPVEKKHRIFRRRLEDGSSLRLPLHIGAMRIGPAADTTLRRAPATGSVLRQLVDEQVLERFAPAHVVVNGEGDVVYYSSRTGKYLEAPSGAPTRQLLTLARRGLRLDLRTLFREAVETGKTVKRNGIVVDSDGGGVQVVDVTVDPLHDRGFGDPLYVVLFEDQGAVVTRGQAEQRVKAVEDDSVIQLERELRDTRERLQTVIEEYETSLEELKSSNEELVSVNEEMQSTNEELEASKEELQSVNEELHTVNSELNSKVDALDRANSDLQNLFDSTNVATVFLDRNLLIRSFTPTMAKIFNILPSDRGRPITDLSSRLLLGDFANDIRSVFSGPALIERRVDDSEGNLHFLARIVPYRDSRGEIQGAIITFVDVTVLTRAETQLRVLVAELQHRTRNLLAIVQSVARQTLPGDATASVFLARLAALGRTQNLSGGEVAGAVELEAMVRMEMEAMGGGAKDRITIEGPKVLLDLEVNQTLGLALHELATNAVKYGALQTDTGRLRISWHVSRNKLAGDRLIFTWGETGVSPMPESADKGFGRKLIEDALAFTLRAKSRFKFNPDGIECCIEMPLPPGSVPD